MKLLVLEDDAEDFLLLSRMAAQFRDLKADVMRATSYAEALQILKESYFDAVLVDYYLGAQDGLEFIGEARAEGVRCPMILLTGQGGGDVDLEALRLGAADYLGKSGLNAPLLERSLRYALERQRAQEALRRSDEY
jgi:CheY-like chemotaxis protein